MKAPPRTRRGALLLEVIVALTIVVTVGTSGMMLAADSARAVARAQRASAEWQAAAQFMDAIALWPRGDLDRRLGKRRNGPWLVTVQHTEPVLYEVSLTLADSPSVAIETVLYRPVPADVTR